MKKILDVCCGGRMFWFDKHNPDATYIDNRQFPKELLTNGQTFEVRPDIVMDFRDIRFPTETFRLVVFDPPHLYSPGKNSWTRKKYGALDRKTWREDIAKGFAECFRVLREDGVLIFKWNEHQIPLVEILALAPYRPLFGHTSGRQSKTHWVTFMKSHHNAKYSD